MKNILALVDLTSLSPKVVDQAIALATKSQAALTLCYIVDSPQAPQEAEAQIALSDFAKQAKNQGVDVEIIIEHGSLFDTGTTLVKRLKPNLVVAGTRGVEAIKKGSFGSTIHKLVKELPGTTLVVNSNSTTVKGGYRKILLPVAPHPDYLAKVEAALDLLADDGEISLFAIVKPGSPFDAPTQANIEATKTLLTSRGAKWNYKEDEADPYAVGYSAQTIRVIKEEGYDLISIMAKVSQRNMHFGKFDKEGVLLNTEGIQVLCTNGPDLD
jgi:nucleotide-binding universal stress UspA family protein